jgi:hypothetical protein
VGLFYGGFTSPSSTTCPSVPTNSRGWGGLFSGFAIAGDPKGGVNSVAMEIYVLRTDPIFTRNPTPRPTARPTRAPSARPTQRPTTARPTRSPTAVPTQRPTAVIPCTRESGSRRVPAVGTAQAPARAA